MSEIDPGQSFLAIIFIVVMWVVQMGVSLGFSKITLDVVDGKKAGISDLTSGFRFLIKMFLASLLYGIIIAICVSLLVGILFGGLFFLKDIPPVVSTLVAALLIIPFFILMIRFSFYTYAILDGMGPIASLKKSWHITKGYVFKIFLFELALAGVMILGFLALVVGIFIAAPTAALAMAYVYRQLSKSE